MFPSKSIHLKRSAAPLSFSFQEGISQGSVFYRIGLIVSFLLLTLITLGSNNYVHASGSGFIEYYIPGGEDQLFDLFQNNDNNPYLRPAYSHHRNGGMHTVISVTVSTDNTTVYYDHWEDGYDFDSNNPSATADEIFTGSEGDVIIMEQSYITVDPRNRLQTYYDGRDRLYIAGGPVTVSRVSWPESAGTVYALAWEVYPTSQWMTSYVVPMGQDLDGHPTYYKDFEHTYILVQAAEDKTAITITDPVHGVTTAYLNQGEVTRYFNNNSGTTVVANRPIQVHTAVGQFHRGARSELRGFTIVPSDLWDSAYYSPISSLSGKYHSEVYIYNPYPTPLDIEYKDSTGTATITVPAKSTRSFSRLSGHILPVHSALYLEASDGSSKFWAVGSGGTANTDGGTNGDYDYGFSLVPKNLLTNWYMVGWAPGSSNTPPRENGSPVWVTPSVDNTTVFVDYSPADGVMDKIYRLDQIQTQKIFDPDHDNTGMRILATNPIAVAWGEDVVRTGNPYLDTGYAILPLSSKPIETVINITKTVNPPVINQGIGEKTTFTLVIDTDNFAITGVTVKDFLPVGWAYISGSSTITLPDGSTISGANADPTRNGLTLSWDKFPSSPLDMLANEILTIQFEAETTQIITDFSINKSQTTGHLVVGPDTLTFTAIDSATIYNSTLKIEKSTNGHDADVAPGPTIAVGDSVHWSYDVTNIGNVNLYHVTVSDDQGVAVSCPKTSLVPKERMTCTANGQATAGQYANIGTVEGETAGGHPAIGTDPSHYFGAYGKLHIEKSTNGVDADFAPGPTVAVGDSVTWNYKVTNVGNEELYQVAVIDDQGVTVSCPKDTLAVSEVMDCTASGTAVAGQYSNLGTVIGTPTIGPMVNNTDRSHYFGGDAKLVIEKLTNGHDADVVPGPTIPVGDAVTWTYIVTNTGNTPLTGVTVTDSVQGVTVTCPQNTLAVTGRMSCSATGVAIAGQYANIGTATGTPPGGLPDVTTTDPSHYYGDTPSLKLEKATNGVDADLAPGPTIPAGYGVTWTYVVTNTGSAALLNVTVVDDKKNINVNCPKDTLAVGESMTCTGSGTATSGQYSNVGLATGKTRAGVVVNDKDPSHYFGAKAALDIEKTTNGDDADNAPGPVIAVGGAVVWNYVVTNTGNEPLINVFVTDDQIGSITCPKDSLSTSESMSCAVSGTAIAGQYSNIGTVTGVSLLGQPATATDPSHYLGGYGALTIEKLTNGQHADVAPGPTMPVGNVVNWTYTVTNTGNQDLINVVATDDQGVTVTCPKTTLVVNQNMICTATGLAVAGQYTNVASVTGEPPVGPWPTATDRSHYFGGDAKLIIEKSTNGHDADTKPGPTIPVGDTVTWTYVVTNTGNELLTGVTVIDNQPGVVVSCPKDTLAVSESMSCSATGIAVAGPYANIGTAEGNPSAGQPAVATDPSHYFGGAPALTIEKSTNGQDADTTPGPMIPVGDPVNWSYEVTNTGNVELDPVTVTDDQGIVVSCPKSILAPQETMLCSASGIAIAGQYSNIGTATETDTSISAKDPSHYFGSNGALDIEKSTNGHDADVTPGPMISVGDPVTWHYVVTNTGNVELTQVAVTDDQGVVVSCPKATLAIRETMTCTANGIALADQYANMGNATGMPPVGSQVSAVDPSHYFGGLAALAIEKSTNSQDADVAPGPTIPIGDTVTWVYEVTNTGNEDLSGVIVTDDQGVTVTCPQTTLVVSEKMSCTATGIAVTGQYTNVASVTGVPPVGPPPTATDRSHYFGGDAKLVIEKSTNGHDADLVTGPIIPVGDPVTWTYMVTNTGNESLSSVTVTDDQPGVVVICPQDTLAVSESMSCSANGVAVAGQYANKGTAVGTPPVGLPVSVTDPSHYFGGDPSLTIEKSTNGLDADLVPGPFIEVGHGVTWTYLVTNTGNEALTYVRVTDDQGITVSCPKTTLAIAESMSCSATGTAVAGQYRNLGTATGTPLGSTPGVMDVTATDPSHYFGAKGGLDIEKSTNGYDADTSPGPVVAVGDAIIWNYVVTNTGNVALTQVTVTDDQGIIPSCPKDSLAIGESMTCTASGIAVADQYANLGIATGLPPVGSKINTSDPSHYFGGLAALAIEKATNGQDADSAPGPTIPVGDTVTWTYVVTNTGNEALTNVFVTDDKLGSISCPQSILAVNESMTCTTIAAAVAGQYTNVAFVTGTPPVGPPPSATDRSHYFGGDAKLIIEKSTNGHDADVTPGPTIPVGDTVTWTYVVTNTGNETLSGVSVTDDKGVVVICPQDVLLASESMNCSATGTAAAGQYANIGTAVGTPPAGLPVSVTDPSHYFGADPSLVIEKSTNGQDADLASGPFIPVGHGIVWTYEVTNTGNKTLAGIAVTDDQGVAVTCPKDTLVIGEKMTCTALGTTLAGQYRNIGKVVGYPVGGVPVTGKDPSHYFGAKPILNIEKTTNGQDADTAPGPAIPVGDPVTWEYIVKNSGNVALSKVVVTDDQGVVVTCPKTILHIAKSMICTATGNAMTGQYANIGTVTAKSPDGTHLTATDPSHYFGDDLTPPVADDAKLKIEKSTNGEDADTVPGPNVKVGNTVKWIYRVVNSGNVDLTDVTITDDKVAAVDISCPNDGNSDNIINLLPVGASVDCIATGIAVPNQYSNIGSVVGNAPGQLVTDKDPSHYFGKIFPWPMFYPAFIPPCPPVPDYCYLVADSDNEYSTNSPLFKYTYSTDTMELLNRLGVNNVEAITLSLDGKTLYATDNGVFGIIDPTSGITNSFTPINSGGVGMARGQLGRIDIYDIDGLSFDPQTGILYGSVRHGDGLPGQLDLLIQIDPNSGIIIADAFGPGVDYIVLDTTLEHASDVDDIAIDSDGTIFGIAGNSGGGGGDQLIIINNQMGSIATHGPLNHNGAPIQDMEGLTLFNTKVLYGTTGIEFMSEGTDNSLYRIDKASGQTTRITRLDQDFNGYIPGDFEAISCFPVCK